MPKVPVGRGLPLVEDAFVNFTRMYLFQPTPRGKLDKPDKRFRRPKAARRK